MYDILVYTKEGSPVRTGIKEDAVERFEVISRTADECTYILEDGVDIDEYLVKTKLLVRLNRMYKEIIAIDRMM